MTASDHLKHRTGSLGGDQDEKAVEQIIAQASDFSNVPHDALLVAHADLFNYARELEASLAQKTRECEELKLQAQVWAGEAKAQKATVHACYEIVTGKTGEPGDWNGAEPIRKHVADLKAQVEQLGRQVAEMEARIETLIGRTCKRCERGDPLFVEPDTGFYTHTFGGNYCDAHRLHSVLNTKVGVEARARTK